MTLFRELLLRESDFPQPTLQALCLCLVLPCTRPHVQSGSLRKCICSSAFDAEPMQRDRVAHRHVKRACARVSE